jgi:hypothetical protein
MRPEPRRGTLVLCHRLSDTVPACREAGLANRRKTGKRNLRLCRSEPLMKNPEVQGEATSLGCVIWINRS